MFSAPRQLPMMSNWSHLGRLAAAVFAASHLVGHPCVIIYEGGVDYDAYYYYYEAHVTGT